MLLHAPLPVPSDAAVRGTKPRGMPQAAPSAAVPRTGVGEGHVGGIVIDQVSFIGGQLVGHASGILRH